MVSKRIVHLIVAGMVFFPLQPSFGGSSGELTQESIQGFIDSIPEVKEWNKTESAELAKQKTVTDAGADFMYGITSNVPSSSYEAVLASTRDPYLARELGRVVAKYGFETTDDWIYTGERLSNAYLSIHGTFDNAEGRKHLNAAAESIDNTQSMPTGYQDVMMDVIGAAQASVAEIDGITPAEKDLVKRNLPLLKTMFDNAE